MYWFATERRGNSSDGTHFQDVIRACSRFVRNAGGSRTHFDRVAAGCLAIWLQRFVVRRCDGRVSVFVPKSSRPDWSHQKRPDLRQHRLNRSPLPHGQGSLRPSFSSSCFSPWMIRTPHLTCVSDGKPRRRLLMGSKAVVFVVLVFVSHWFAPFRVIETDSRFVDG